MTKKFVSLKQLNFLLFDVLDLESLCQYPYFEDHSRETFVMLLDTSLQIAKDLMHPAFAEMDSQQPEFIDNTIKVYPTVKKYLKVLGEGGWIATGFPFEDDGQQFPATLVYTNLFIAGSANFSLAAYPAFTTAAAQMILSYGSIQMKQTYLPHLFSGKWQGTMAMTEPAAGSSTFDITTTAEEIENGVYSIQGQKVFISAGEHDAVDNIVHIMLAKITGEDSISLFLVPKQRIDKNGNLEPNDVVCSGTYHKMGYRGCPVAQLSLGDNKNCRGYLLGEPNKGLTQMFGMINETRLGAGVLAAAGAAAAYYSALEYTGERKQGKSIEKTNSNNSVPIIEYADVKRMLLFQRSVAEGALSLCLYTAKLYDLIRVSEGQEKEKHKVLLDLLIPVAKSYPAEMGVQSTSLAIQCFGGYGYCDEFPVEQHFRNSRIHPIHGGTTGIQGIDLLGRKIIKQDGKALALLQKEVEKTISEAENITQLKPSAIKLKNALSLLNDVTDFLRKHVDQNKMELFLADATLYLEFFGIFCIAWQWLIQGIAAQKKFAGDLSETEICFYTGKLNTLLYFFCYELPKMEALGKCLTKSDGLTVNISRKHFVD